VDVAHDSGNAGGGSRGRCCSAVSVQIVGCALPSHCGRIDSRTHEATFMNQPIGELNPPTA